MVDSVGRRIWEIEKEVTSVNGKVMPFTALSIDENHAFWAYNFGGYNCQYDPDSGKILRCEFIK